MQCAVSHPNGLIPEQRVSRALEATSVREPRPMVAPELPPAAAHWLDDQALARLAPAAVLVPIVQRPAEGAGVVLTVRSTALRKHAGQVSFPGGRRDAPDAGPVENALREADEEIGLDPRRVTVAGYLDDYPTITGFRVTPVVGFVAPPVVLCVDGVEATDHFEVPLAYLLDPTNYRRRWFQRDGVDVPVYEVPYGERVIWGATAGMLHDLASRCRALA